MGAAVPVGVGAGEGVSVGEGVPVGVTVGVAETVEVGEAVAVGVTVGVSVLEGVAVCAGVVAVGEGVAVASSPEQPIRLIVAYAAGGGTDIVARLLAQYVQKQLGSKASIVVLNRPGAGGAIGFTELRMAPPDGYTIGFINTPNVLTIPIERRVAFSFASFGVASLVAKSVSISFSTPSTSALLKWPQFDEIGVTLRLWNQRNAME